MNKIAKRVVPTKENTFIYKIMKDLTEDMIKKGLNQFNNSWQSHLQKKNVYLSQEKSFNTNKEVSKIVESFIELEREIKENKSFVKLKDNLEDVEIWNSKLDDYNEENKVLPKYFDAPMLYTECYIYRCFYGFLQNSKHFKNLDIFFQSKCDSLIRAIEATEMIMNYTAKISERINDKNKSIEQEFVNYLELDLWGNMFDLACPIGEIAIKNINLNKNFCGQLKKQKDKIMCNSTDNIYKFFLENKDKPISRIDIALDNAGYELIGDFCFVEMLYQTNLIDENKTVVNFHPKNYPWFVSDVLEHDFHWVLNYLCSNLKDENSIKLAEKWASNFKEGRWVLKKHYFWTTPYEYCEMKNISLDLYEDLCRSDLILFKGDLHYRKLVSDMLWDLSTPFKIALRGFHPTNLVALRTIKSCPLCDLKNSELYLSYDEKTKYSGELGVISFYKKE